MKLADLFKTDVRKTDDRKIRVAFYSRVSKDYEPQYNDYCNCVNSCVNIAEVDAPRIKEVKEQISDYIHTNRLSIFDNTLNKEVLAKKLQGYFNLISSYC